MVLYKIFPILFFDQLYNYIILYVFLKFRLLLLLYFQLQVLYLNCFPKISCNFHLVQSIYLHYQVYLQLLNYFLLQFLLFVLCFQNQQEEIIHVQLILLEYSIEHSFDLFFLHLIFLIPIFHIFHYILFSHNVLLLYIHTLILLPFPTYIQISYIYYILYMDLVSYNLNNNL